jgi:hypothetical protein
VTELDFSLVQWSAWEPATLSVSRNDWSTRAPYPMALVKVKN